MPNSNNMVNFLIPFHFFKCLRSSVSSVEFHGITLHFTLHAFCKKYSLFHIKILLYAPKTILMPSDFLNENKFLCPPKNDLFRGGGAR